MQIIVLLSFCLTVPALAADRAAVAQQITDVEVRIETVSASYADRIAAAEAELERVRVEGNRALADAEERVAAAQAAIADAYRVRPGRRATARGRRLQLVSRDVTLELAQRLGVPEVRGALVGKIKYDSDAYVAGLRAGDVILVFDGLPVVSSADLQTLAKRAARARKVYVEVWRDHAEVIIGLPAIEEPRVRRARAKLDRARDNLSAADASMMERTGTAERALATLREEQSSELTRLQAELDGLRAQLVALNQRFGVRLTRLPSDVASYFQVNGGAYVRAVDPGSRAFETGLQAADIVVRFAGRPVRDPRQLTEMIRATGAEESVRVEVVRNGERVELTTPGAVDT